MLISSRKVKTRHFLLSVALFLCTSSALAQVTATATRTIFLPRGTGTFSSPMNVAYHPSFDQYYASTGGSPSFQASVYDNTGAIVNNIATINIDVRAWNYNPNTGLMEVVTYNANAGGTGFGLIQAQLDGSGFYTGGTTELLAVMPGNINTQTMPAYDSGNNVFYSRSSGNTVNVVSRTNGSLLNTFNLDTASASSGTLNSNALGFSEPDGWLIVIDTTNNTAVVFDTSGNYVGTSALDISTEATFGAGFANGQLFAWDDSRSGWQGYNIGGSGPGIAVLEPATPVPTLSAYGIVLTALGLLLVATRRLRSSARKK